MNKPLTFLLSLTFLFLFSGSVYGDSSKDESAVIDPKLMEMIKAFTEHDSKKLYDLNLYSRRNKLNQLPLDFHL